MKRTQIFKIDKLEFDPIELPEAHKRKGRPLLTWMMKKGIPLTWSNWLRVSYGDDILSDPERLRETKDFIEIPEEFQQDIDLFSMKQSGGIQ
jgi:hypothetical protein